MMFSAQDIISNNTAINLYHSILRDNSNAINYLTKDRGLTKKTLKAFKIGYAPDYNIIVSHLQESGMPWQHWAKQNSTDDFFTERIIIPNIIINNTVFVTGRSFPDSEPAHLHMRGGITNLFNESILTSVKKICVVESPICAVTLAQYGIPAVAKFGTGSRNLLRIPKSTKIYFIPDREPSNIGEADSLLCAAFLRARGYKEIYIVKLQPSGSKVDVNSFMLEHSKEDFIAALKTGIAPENYGMVISVNKLGHAGTHEFATLLRKFTPRKIREDQVINNRVIEVKEKSDIKSVISKYSTIIDRGDRCVCLCPIHSETKPSFYIYPEQTWFCFGCSEGGDVISFIQRVENVSFQDALDILEAYI